MALSRHWHKRYRQINNRPFTHRQQKRFRIVANEKNSQNSADTFEGPPSTKVKFEIYGEEMIEKEVKLSGNSGRVYLPPNWVGHQVKIIRID